jgi:magnesium-transporting ATPase (P-type)
MNTHFVPMFCCNVIVSIICLFVYIATSRSEIMRNPKPKLGEVPGIASKRQVVSLITFFGLIMFMFFIITMACLG